MESSKNNSKKVSKPKGGYDRVVSASLGGELDKERG